MSLVAVLNALFTNFCVLVTLTFFGSLTYTGAPTHQRQRRLLRALLAAASGLLLLLFTVHAPGGVLMDLRAIPVVLAGLLGNPLAALLVALPVAGYRTWLGGPAVLPALLNLAVLVAVSGWLWRPRLGRVQAAWRGWWLYLLTFLVSNLVYFLVPGLSPVLALRHTVLLSLTQLLGLLAALAVLNVRFRAIGRLSNYRSQAYLDALTGLANRRQFDEDLGQLPAGERAHLVMLDIDHFKQVNDRYGHIFGDRVLRALGGLLAGNMREGQRAYRLGGEEFAVLLRGCDALAAARAADRLRELVAERLPGRVEMPELTLTLSLGVAAYEGHPARMLDLADARLYAAKRGGRNRTIVEGGQPG